MLRRALPEADSVGQYLAVVACGATHGHHIRVSLLASLFMATPPRVKWTAGRKKVLGQGS